MQCGVVRSRHAAEPQTDLVRTLDAAPHLLGAGHKIKTPPTSPRPLTSPRVTMRTRSREGPGGGDPAEAETLVSLPLQPPRSSKKRKAGSSGSGTTTPAATKKSKEVATSLEPPAPTAPEASTPGKAGEKEGESRSKTKKSASKAGEHDVAACAGKEGQSLDKGKDGKRAHDGPITAADRMGVAPKGRCVSGRDWKARNQSQR